MSMLAQSTTAAAAAFSVIPLLRNLPLDERRQLLRHAQLSDIRNGRILARAGCPAETISFLVEGGARLVQSDGQGTESTIALLGPGAHVGVVSLLTKTNRLTDVIATCRCALLSFQAAFFEEHLRRYPGLCFSLLQSTSTRLNETSRHLSEAALYELPRRLVLRLLDLAVPVPWDGGERLLVRQRPSHQELANMLGVSRESVTRALKKLSKERHLIIDDDQVFVISTPL